MEYSEAIVGGIPLIVVVIGLVEMLKKLGVHDNWLILASMLVGIVLGIGYKLSLAPIAGFSGWFGAVIYGLGLGLVASGLYAAVKSATSDGLG